MFLQLQPSFKMAFMAALSVCWATSATAQLGARAESATPPVKSTSSANVAKTRWVLREGTSVGPIVGRITSSGNQWRFIPDEVNLPANDATQDGALPPGIRPVAGQEQQSMLNKTIATKLDEVEDDNPMGRSSPSPATVAALTSILVVENLMLQRVVDAVEENPIDVHWRITGVVTEFRDENRLILKTIERAPSISKAQ